MASEIRRIFIDSRLRNPTSASNADWSVDLPLEVLCPAGTEARVDSLVMSHSWPTVETNKNDKLYLKETLGSVTYHRIVTLDPGIYSIGTLGAQLQAKLRSGSNISDGVYSITNANNRLEFANSSPTASVMIYSRKVTSSNETLTINWTFPSGSVIAESSDFPTIWSAANVVGPPTPPTPIADCCELIGLMTNSMQLTPGVPGKCEHIDLARHKALYLCSNSLPSTSIDLHGRGDIIRKIIIGNSEPGSVVVDQLASNVAFAYFATETVLRHLSFTIRDFSGGIATLNGHQISFVIELSRPSDR